MLNHVILSIVSRSIVNYPHLVEEPKGPSILMPSTGAKTRGLSFIFLLTPSSLQHPPPPSSPLNILLLLLLLSTSSSSSSSSSQHPPPPPPPLNILLLLLLSTSSSSSTTEKPHGVLSARPPASPGSSLQGSLRRGHSTVGLLHCKGVWLVLHRSGGLSSPESGGLSSPVSGGLSSPVSGVCLVLCLGFV